MEVSEQRSLFWKVHSTNDLIWCFAEVLAEALYLSVDPYMRVYMERFPVGVQMIGGQVAR